MIDEKVLIERLKKKRNASDTKFDNVIEMNAYDDGVDDSIEIVNQLAEEQNNGWIPCSERLPEVNTRVMCFTENKTYVFAEYGGADSHYLDTKDVWFSDKGWYRKDSIIAWQPLPAPYQPKE